MYVNKDDNVHNKQKKRKAKKRQGGIIQVTENHEIFTY